jgi:hypothetical protein
MAAPFGPKTAVEAEADDLFLITRGTGGSLEVEKVDPTAAETAALIAAGIDAYLDTDDWRTGGGAGGATLRNGSGAPSGGTGSDNDFYIRTSDWTIYGPKASGSWGSGTALNGSDGSDGIDGANGAQFLSGSGTPRAGPARTAISTSTPPASCSTAPRLPAPGAAASRWSGPAAPTAPTAPTARRSPASTRKPARPIRWS